MTFLAPWWLLAAAILFAGFCLVRHAHHRGDWYRVINHQVLAFLSASGRTTSRRNTALLLATITAVALSNPSIPTQDSNTYHHAEGWFVLADVSRSMTLDDIAPSRQSAMRDVAQELAVEARSRPISLIIYAGDAFMVTPPAFDTRHFLEHAALLEHGLIPLDGSNLTRALALASSVIDSSQILQARLFVLSDTGGFNTKAQTAVSHLASQGYRADFVVFGSENSSNNAKFDLAAANDLAHAGNGVVVTADLLGGAQLDNLNLEPGDNNSHSLIPSGIALLRWHSLAHWVLLPALLVLFALFVRENA